MEYISVTCDTCGEKSRLHYSRVGAWKRMHRRMHASEAEREGAALRKVFGWALLLGALFLLCHLATL